MKVTQKNTDDLSAILTLTIEKSDYEPRVKKNLSDYRRSAEIKGFRPGMAPMGLIEKMHKRTALLEEINKIITESLPQYISDNNLHLLGDPIPCEAEQKSNNLEDPDDIEFAFEIGLAPKVHFTLSKSDTITYYNIPVTDEERAQQKENILKQNGQMVDTETAGDDAFLKVDLTQGDYRVEDTYIALNTIAAKTLRKPFLGKKAGDEWSIDVKKTFTNETDLAALLKVKKEDLAGIAPQFTVTIKEIKQIAPAELNQELYDRLFGAGAVTSEQEFMQKIEDRLRESHTIESEYRFTVDAHKALLEKARLELPEAFLKRWLNHTNEGKMTAEEIDRNFPPLADDWRRQIIYEYIFKEQNIEITSDDLMVHARKMAIYQFRMYGIHNMSGEQVDHYAKSILANDKENKRIYEKVASDKVIEYVKATVTLVEKDISFDRLQKMYETEQ